LLVGLSGCTPERGEGLFPHQDAVARDQMTFDYTADADIGALTPLTGWWLLLTQTSICVETLGMTAENLSWCYYVLHTRETGATPSGDGQWIEVEAHPCAKDLSPIVLGLKVEVPDPVFDTMSPSVFDCLVTPGPGGAPPETTPGAWLTGSSFACQPEVELWGVSLSDPLSEPMPESADDERVFDQDLDGNPGVTLKLLGDLCDMYVVQRTIGTFEGEFSSPILASGVPQLLVEQHVIGGTEALCLTENQTTVHPERNRLYLIRIDGFEGSATADTDGDGRIGCAELDSALEKVLSGVEAPLDEPSDAECR